MCSGKIYYDLIEAREKSKNDKVVFIRLEQIYPFPVKRLGRELKRYAEKLISIGVKRSHKIWVLGIL